MIDEQKLYELLKDFDLGGSSYPFFEGNTVYTVIPHFAEKGSEGIVKKLKRLMEKDLWEKESET